MAGPYIIYIYIYVIRVGTGRGETLGTEQRKNDHIRICMEKDVQFRKTAGFEKFSFPKHNALPEMKLDDVKLDTVFLGRKFRVPLFIEAMTGGTPEAGKINRNLAQAAQELGIGMGLGSQRAMIERPELANTYKVRDVAPDIFLAGNIGAVQLHGVSVKQVREALDDVEADALAVHLNPAQEIAQKEGDRNFTGLLGKIEELCGDVGYPVIAKEVGCGISGEVARRLESAGVKAIDVAGAGGTSWVKVDGLRGEKEEMEFAETFGEWGIPTAQCLLECRTTVKIPLIASGGIRNGLDVAKAIAMGASIAGMALPLLRPAVESPRVVKNVLEKTIKELKSAMLLTGAGTIMELSKVKL